MPLAINSFGDRKGCEGRFEGRKEGRKSGSEVSGDSGKWSKRKKRTGVKRLSSTGLRVSSWIRAHRPFILPLSPFLLTSTTDIFYNHPPIFIYDDAKLCRELLLFPLETTMVIRLLRTRQIPFSCPSRDLFLFSLKEKNNWGAPEDYACQGGIRIHLICITELRCQNVSRDS